ncbi:hypothetical protein [Streptomyces albireticuli]|uniref:Uncharacterized protein n=1 Tax=Streptomyces albireticuli TaxID=1940 RepID=A0A2A2CY96_9ACTN|nr:hypothetical protein [Streptomyces albireticuli]MCD9145054.1 hypothetical protein [Streptomyces albireticuli]MCD9164480.1 hypothetical protein [Streptomyces albireticuli]MCD9194191.1 hypothetical protein [Streptomyces albireticuli]PAU44126.1 hypothetical protein CK936_36580 [Streptomyces albireticuli]
MLFDLKAEADMRLHSDRMAAELAEKRRERLARETGAPAGGEGPEPEGKRASSGGGSSSGGQGATGVPR